MARGVEREATVTDEDDREAPAATAALSRASPDYISIALMPSCWGYMENPPEEPLNS